MFKVYGKPNCPYCTKATNELYNKDKEYIYVDISANESARNYIKEELGAKTVPQIFDGHFLVGGFEDLVHYIDSNTQVDEMFDQLWLLNMILILHT